MTNEVSANQSNHVPWSGAEYRPQAQEVDSDIIVALNDNQHHLWVGDNWGSRTKYDLIMWGKQVAKGSRFSTSSPQGYCSFLCIHKNMIFYVASRGLGWRTHRASTGRSLACRYGQDYFDSAGAWLSSGLAGEFGKSASGSSTQYKSASCARAQYTAL